MQDRSPPFEKTLLEAHEDHATSDACRREPLVRHYLSEWVSVMSSGPPGGGSRSFSAAAGSKQKFAPEYLAKQLPLFQERVPRMILVTERERERECERGRERGCVGLSLGKEA